MYIPSEIIVLFFLISFMIYTAPAVLIKFSKTTKGKFLLLILTIIVTLYNRTGGLIMAMFYIFLSEMNYEFNNGLFYEGFDAKANTDANADTNANADTDADNATIKKKDKLSVEQELIPKDSSSTKSTQ